MSVLYEAEGTESGIALESKIGKQKWVSQIDSGRGNETKTYEDKLTNYT